MLQRFHIVQSEPRERADRTTPSHSRARTTSCVVLLSTRATHRKARNCPITGEEGRPYQLEAQAFWDSGKGGDVRVMVAADDGGWRAFKPLTGDFIMRPDGSFVDE